MARHLTSSPLVERRGHGCRSPEEVESMSLSPTRRRAEDFARLLDSGARTDDPVTAPLLAVSAALGALPAAAGPRPEFRDALRRRVVAVAAVQGVGEPETPTSRLRAASSTWRVQRRVSAIAAG